MDGLAGWHRVVRDNDPDGLEALLAEDAVFLSPIVHTPQIGRAKAGLYLRLALALLNNGAFRYVGEWHAPGSAVLEFEGLIDGVVVNGVDMIFWNEAGRITRFKVMVRPLKAINLMHERMRMMLESAGAIPAA